MPIQRSGPTPPYYEYVVTNALVPRNGPPSAAAMAAAGLGIEWIEIPSYQRGISWTLENVLELIASDSVLMGTVLMGKFGVPQGRFPDLPTGVAQYSILVDGLQRLSVGTALLSLLEPRVLAATATSPHAAFFAAIKTAVASRLAVAVHNNLELTNHPRQVLRDQYVGLRDALASYLDDQLGDAASAQQFADDLGKTFIEKQVAVDIYFNFPTARSLMSTFLGINTIRVDLGPIDLVRAYIIEEGEDSGWTPADIESVENSFADVFVDGEKPDRELLPFVNSTYKFLGEVAGTGDVAADIFPSWGGTLVESEVDRFIDLAREVKQPSANGYVREIRAAGTLPLSILLAYFYKDVVRGGPAPSFLSGGTATDTELHQFLRAIYRTLIAGKIGRLSPIVDRCLRGTYTTLGAVADDIAASFAEVPLAQPLAKNWLIERLSSLKKPNAPRVFNAMLLPSTAGGTFEPLVFGLANDHFQIDHLIPEAALRANQPGRQDGQTLRNFAPLPRPFNHTAKNTPCQQKLAAAGLYEQWLCNPGGPHPPHYFGTWLLCAQTGLGNALDDQGRLERNATPAVGDERIEFIADALVPNL